MNRFLRRSTSWIALTLIGMAAMLISEPAGFAVFAVVTAWTAIGEKHDRLLRVGWAVVASISGFGAVAIAAWPSNKTMAALLVALVLSILPPVIYAGRRSPRGRVRSRATRSP